eukprot:jgi/Galph1/744/GphlegSOOS_G5456.1
MTRMGFCVTVCVPLDNKRTQICSETRQFLKGVPFNSQPRQRCNTSRVVCLMCKTSSNPNSSEFDNKTLRWLKLGALTLWSCLQLSHQTQYNTNSATLFAPPLQSGPVLAASTKVKRTLKAKLSQVPVFAVTNSAGQPYLVEDSKDRIQKGYIFFSPQDAIKMIDRIKKANSTEDIHIHVIGLDKAYEMVSSPPKSAGLKDEEGKDLLMTFLLYPDSSQLQKARELVRKENKKASFDGVPVFVARGLTLKKGDESNVPVFLDKDDLEEAWKKLRESDSSLPTRPVIEIAEFVQLLKEMERDGNGELQNLGFFASRKSIDWIRNQQSKG